jgi:plastocyanin
MMQRWLICFSAALLALTGASGSTVSGAVEISTTARKPPPVTDVVVWLESAENQPVLSTPPAHAQMLQKDKMFHPHVLPVEVGTIVDFPNADPIFHNAFSNYEGQLFDVSLYPPGTSRSVTFRKAGIVRVFCNIHPSMSAVILVLKNPYFVKVSADGSYHIPNVPPGRYELHFYDERCTGQHPSLRLTVDAGGSPVAAPALHISESRYLTVPPHKNKFGQDYPKDAGSYSTEAGPPK